VPVWSGEAFTLEDFRAYMPAHQYICLPTGELWPASSVDAKLAPIDNVKPSKWLDQNQSVEQMTWAPGMPTIIQDKTVTNGGWADKRGYAVFNLYKPPAIAPGDAAAAGPWLDHVRRVYPDDADHIVCYLAHRVQRPHEKINHGLVLGGPPGIGKDTLIEPVKRAVGPWNVQEISPQQVLGRFNGFIKSVILRISEARDLGELNRFGFYEHMKVFLAAPPDVIRCDEKNLREHSVFNVVGVIITSNRKDSFYLPADDRRHYVAWTDLTQADFPDNYWDELWGWYEAGGDRHVAAYLATLDLKDFNPKAPPKKTDVFWQIVETNRAPENSQLDDAIDELGEPDHATPGGIKRPDVITLDMIRQTVTGGFLEWLTDGKNARQIPHRMGECGYVPVQNGAAKDGLWRINEKRQVIYAKAELSVSDRLAAATALTKKPAGQKDMWRGGGR
jgi:DNA polymerase III delta prime subunit